MDDATLVCPAILEWVNKYGVVQRKVAFKKGYLRLIRNEARVLFLEVSAEKAAPVKLPLKGVTVHNKFMNEGKATIKFQEQLCTVYLSNAPPAQLLGFLRTVFIKMTGTKSSAQQNSSLRTQVLSNKPSQYDEISPVRTADVHSAKKKVAKSTDTTPSPLSRKRKLNDENAPAAKRSFSSHHSFNEPLNMEQKEVLEACLDGHNVFFTGSAGTGKSYLLRKIIGALPPDVTTATASTGVAACHIGGITLHQFAGIGSGDATLERAYELACKPTTASIWRKCKHLIIDEISMIDGNYFEKVEAVARRVRRNEKPFGGIQLILCGDFLQLPPVVKFNENKKLCFCFQTDAWNKCVHRSFELKQVHRQTDTKFIEILNKVRVGDVPQSIVDKLLATSKQKIEQNGILATRLCSHMQDANTINESKLNDLKGEIRTFSAQDSDPHLAQQMDQQSPVPGKLILKVNAQVMLLKNISISEGLVNGARGVVKEFRDGLPIVKFRNNKEYTAKHEKWTIKLAGGVVITRKQVPLKLAWAFSIHKSQGLTLDCVEMSLARVFEAGQAYVALSRAQSLESLRVLDFKASQVWANPDVLEFYQRLRDNMEEAALVNTLYPLGKKSEPQVNKQLVKKKPIGKKLFSDKPLVSIS